MLLLLLACTPLVGDWSGEVDCDGFAMDIEVSLDWTGKEYEGEGTLDCTDYYGSECEQTFDVQVRPESAFGEQELDVDVDDCEIDAGGQSGEVGCDNPDDVEWDGANTITGDWAGCDAELERD